MRRRRRSGRRRRGADTTNGRIDRSSRRRGCGRRAERSTLDVRLEAARREEDHRTLVECFLVLVEGRNQDVIRSGHGDARLQPVVVMPILVVLIELHRQLHLVQHRRRQVADAHAKRDKLAGDAGHLRLGGHLLPVDFDFCETKSNDL